MARRSPAVSQVSRRDFIATSTAALAAGLFVNPLRAADSKSPNEKLNIACVGTAGQAGWNISNLQSENIVALCDVDSNYLGAAAQKYSQAKQFRDFRQMLDKEGKNIDAVLVATSDHVHAPATAMALRMGKHVYCEKPLTHTVPEARLMAELAKKAKVATQMGTQIHAGDNYRRTVELVQGGAIGPVKEVHVWVGGAWANGRFNTGTPVPANLDWDLWLGPATERPYTNNVHPAHWRDFWEYGGGHLADLGCHRIDLAHWALDLRHPTACRAEGPEVHPDGCPAWLIVNWDYPARGSLPPVRLTWYHGGKQPDLLKTIKTKDGQPVNWGNGVLFVGDQGMLYSDYGNHVLLPEEKYADFKRPAQTIPASIGHHQEWIQACKTGSPTTCNFDYSGALTEAVLLGNVAYRCGQALAWDAAKLKATNTTEADKFLNKAYRKGWDVFEV
jgi:predicted dehydrogenase